MHTMQSHINPHSLCEMLGYNLKFALHFSMHASLFLHGVLH